MSVKIITDSGSDMPKNMVKELNNVEVIPMKIRFGEEVYRDGIDMDSDTFFEKFKNSVEVPVSHLVPPDQFVKAIERAQKEYDEIVIITISSELSGTYASAVLATEYMSDAKIKVIDSKAASFVTGLIVRDAALMAKKGMNADRIEAEVKKRIKNQCTYVFIETTEFLARRGRLTYSELKLRSIFRRNPILTLDDGKLIVVDKLRTKRQFLNWLGERISEEVEKGDLSKKTIGIAYAENRDDLSVVTEFLQINYNAVNVMNSQMGCIIGAHSVPNCIVVTYNLLD